MAPNALNTTSALLSRIEDAAASLRTRVGRTTLIAVACAGLVVNLLVCCSLWQLRQHCRSSQREEKRLLRSTRSRDDDVDSNRLITRNDEEDEEGQGNEVQQEQRMALRTDGSVVLLGAEVLFRPSSQTSTNDEPVYLE